LTADDAGLLDELDALIRAGSPLDLDCGRLAGCDDAVAGRLADALLKARRAGVTVRLLNADAFLGRLNERLVAGQPNTSRPGACCSNCCSGTARRHCSRSAPSISR
jgi:hypothetical protein